MRQEKMMIICWTIHPWPTGSSIIVNNLLEHMNKDNVVVVGERHPTLVPSWQNHLPKIYYVNPNINICGRGQTHLRWLKYLYIENQVKHIALKEGVTKIFGIFPDDYYLFLAFRLSKLLQTPLFTWFHNTYLDNYTGYRKIIASILQPMVFNYAKRIFVMSDGMKNYFNKKYPGTSFTTLVHGFELPESNRLISTDKKNKIVRFLFTGSLNESCRDATIRMMKVILSKEEYELHVYSGNPKSDFEKYGISGKRFFYHGFISLSELYENMNNYDIMLLPHGLNGKRTDVEFKTIFPTRTIPLLVSGKPILAHAPKDTFLTEFLEYHNCAWIVNEANEFKLLDTINQILVREDETNLKIQNALRVSEMFKIENVLVKLRTEIE